MAADAGHAAAQYCTGECLELGRGIERVPEDAVLYYERAAAQGNSDGQCSLGQCLLAGVGVPRDAGRGFELVKLASDQGNPRGHYRVGLCRELGEGTRRKFSEASRLYALAAAGHFAPGQCALGRCFYYGIGVRRDTGEARTLFRQAAAAGDCRACYYCGMLIECGEEPGTRSADAIEYFTKAAQGSDPLGQCGLGIALARDREFGGAFALFQSAAEQGDAGGFFNCGCCFVRGDGTEVDVEKAYECFRKCLEQGGLYWETKPGERLWYRRSAGLNLIDLSQEFKQDSAGDLSASVNYAWCQWLGEVVPRDVIAATRRFRAAAEQRHAGGMLAYAYALSEGAQTQSSEATQWFADAAMWVGGRPVSASARQQATLFKPVKPRVSKPQAGKQNFLVPGRRFQGVKEQKERKKQAKRANL
jgi:TPR repeat protein